MLPKSLPGDGGWMWHPSLNPELTRHCECCKIATAFHPWGNDLVQMREVIYMYKQLKNNCGQYCETRVNEGCV